MKSRDRKSQRERRVEERRSEKRKSQKKEDAGARKGRKVTKHCVFPMICGTASRLAKAAGAEPSGKMRDEKLHAVVARSTFPSQNVQNTTCSDHFWKLSCRKSARRCGAKHISKSKCTKHTSGGPLLEVEMSKKCTRLWPEAHFEVKMHKAHQVRTTFGRWDVEKVHAVVVRSTFQSQNAQNAPAPDHFWKLRCRKSARCCGAKHISKSKCTKHTSGGPLLEVEMSKKCTRLWREAHFEVKMYKTPHARATFGDSDVVSRGRGKGLRTLSKGSRTWGFCRISKNDGRRGTFEQDLQRCIFRGRGSTRDMFIRAVRRSGRWFPERGCILQPEIFRFAEMTLRDMCSTLYDLASLFRGRRSTLDRWNGKIAKRIGARLSALHATFRCQLWKMKKSLRIAAFFFNVVKLSNSKNWGSLA